MRRVERHLVVGRRQARHRMLCGAPSCNERLGRYRLREHGRLREWSCMQPLGAHESGWDAYAVNESSGAAGIPQALGHGDAFALGDADAQIDWFMDYVDDRYGGFCSAWDFWLLNGWY